MRSGKLAALVASNSKITTVDGDVVLNMRLTGGDEYPYCGNVVVESRTIQSVTWDIDGWWCYPGIEDGLDIDL